MERKLVLMLVIGMLAISIAQTAFIYYTSLSVVSDSEVTAQAITPLTVSATVRICLNTPPALNFPCSPNINQSSLFICSLNATDVENQTLTYSYSTVSGGLAGTIDANGLYVVTPTQNMTGISTLEFYANDTSGCNNAATYLNVTFNVTDRNDPPIYSSTIAGISIEEGSSYRGLFLDDYYTDPDGDALTYTYFSFSSSFNFIILGTSEVIITPLECTDGSVIFQARDPYNASADSGVISISMNCQEESKSGGGGGGASSSSCKTEWDCGEWERCLINNTQRRTCVDINGCADPYERYFWQECRYVAHCYNEVRDLDEEGVDCGGADCDICQTCHDDKLNNEEVEVDCGGPNCNACSNCADGIQNYQETGLDCGGPSCELCPSCSDGIQNQEETGLDCGGPYCSACTRIEAPTLIDGNSNQERFNIIILSSFLGLAILAVTYRIFKNQIHALIATLLLALALKRRKQVLLTADQKDFLLARIASIETKDLLAKSKESKVVYQDLLSRLQRQFFSFLIGSVADSHSAHKKIDHLKTSKVLKSLLKRQYTLLDKLEKEKSLSKLQLQFMMESIRTLIFNISKVDKKEITRVVSERDDIKKPQTALILQDLYNGMLACQFSKDGAARKKYISALKIYQELTDKEKSLIYDELVVTFHHLSYAASFR